MSADVASRPPCPKCRQPLAWSDVNNQWFCQKCELFYQPGQGGTAALDHIAEEISRAFSGRPATPVYPCQGCGVPLSFIQQYGRWYCYGCRKWY